MTSRKSFQNNFGYAYRTGLRDNVLFPALNMLFLLFFFVLQPLLGVFRQTTTQDASGQFVSVDLKKQYAFVFSTGLEYTRYFVLAVLLIAGVLTGIAVFRFITGKKTVNVYYSLGITRAKLFTAKYLSGLTLLFASVFVPMLASLVLNIVYLGVNKYMLLACLYEAVGMFSLAAVAYSLTAAVFTTVGTVFEGGLFSAILLFFPEMLFTCLGILIQKLVVGAPYGFVFGSERMELTDSFEPFNPLRYFSEGLYVYSTATAKHELNSYDSDSLMSWAAPSFLRPLLWLAVAAALFGLGVLLYKRRKAEIGGFIGTNKALNFIGIFIVAFFGFTEAYNILNARGMALAIAVGAAVFCVIYAVLSLLLLRNFKQFAKDLVALPIQLVVTALIFTFFATGYFGAANRVPKAEDVSYAQISAVYADSVYKKQTEYMRYSSYSYNGSSSFIQPTSTPFGKYESARDIEFIRSVHQKLVEAGRTEPQLLNDDYNGTRQVAVQMEYVLKNGKVIRRAYYGVDEATLRELAKICETDYYKSELENLFKSPLKAVEEPKRDEFGRVTSGDYNAYMQYKYMRQLRESDIIRIYNKSLSVSTMPKLTDAQKQTLLDCLYKDLSALTAENRYAGKNVLGAISFTRADMVAAEYGVDEPVTVVEGAEVSDDGTVVWDGKEVPMDDFVGLYWMDNIPVFLLTSDMPATVQFLKNTGYFDALSAKPEIQKVRIQKVAYVFSPYLTWINGNRANAGFEFLAESSETDEYDEGNDVYGMVASTDAAVIKQLYEAAVPRAIAQPQDYMVTFFTADNKTSMYVSADQMPETLKKQVADKADVHMW